MLGGQPDWLPDDKSILYKGLLDLDNLPEDEISPFCRSLYWEQGVPENDLHLPGMMEHHARRGDSQPTSEFYEIPFHMISVKCERFEKMHEKILADPFEKSVIHLCLCLSYRNRIAEQMRIGNMFRFEDVAKKCNISIYSSKMVVGQMIKVGLIEFDKFSGKTWHDESQEFVLTSLATNLIANKIPS